MLVSAAVTVIVNGAIVPSVASARIVGGRVVAPVAPIVVRLATRIAVDASRSRVAIDGNGARIVVPIVYTEEDVPYVELAPVVAALGGSDTFDSRSKTLTIVLRPAGGIATPAPFDPDRPEVAPNPVFTPAPPPATPRAIESGVPRPRRTAIPAVPSQPVVPSTPEPSAYRPASARILSQFWVRGESHQFARIASSTGIVRSRSTDAAT